MWKPRVTAEGPESSVVFRYGQQEDSLGVKRNIRHAVLPAVLITLNHDTSRVVLSRLTLQRILAHNFSFHENEVIFIKFSYIKFLQDLVC